MSKPKKIATKSGRRSPVGRYNSFIYPNLEDTRACARFAYRYPIELVRAYEKIEAHDPDNKEALRHVIPIKPERDHQTDAIIDAIVHCVGKPGSGICESTMADIIAIVWPGKLPHKVDAFRNSKNPRKALCDVIYQVAKKLGRGVKSDTKTGARSKDELIRRALYDWWDDHVERRTTSGVDKHGNPTRSQFMLQPTIGPSKEELRTYLKMNGMQYPPQVHDKDFWKKVLKLAKKLSKQPFFCIHVPVDKLQVMDNQ